MPNLFTSENFPLTLLFVLYLWANISFISVILS